MTVSTRWLIAPFAATAVFVGLLSPVSISAQDTVPGVTLPEPTGEYAVGYATYTLTDNTRDEIFTEDEDDKRTFPLTLYYPVASQEGIDPAPYASETEIKAYNKALGIPAFIFQGVQSHLYLDAPLADVEGDGFPVLMFSPGFGTPIKFYTALLEEIASHGYIIAVVDHPYSLGVSVFPNGDVIEINAAGSNLDEDDSRATILNVWVDDTIFALDELERLNADDSLLAGALDLSRVGAFGHSFGGASSAEVSIVDERILAAVNMDGSLFGEAASGVAKPFLMLMSEALEATDAELEANGMTREDLEAAIEEYNTGINAAVTASEAGYKLRLAGSRHNTYTSDMPLVRQILPMFITEEQVGTIDGTRANEVVSAYILAFFDQSLNGQVSPLLEGPSPDYPEITFEPIEAAS